MRPEISIIIPTKNEEEGIAKVLCSIPKEVERKSEVIVVDTSADLTPIIAKRLGAKVLHLGKRRGGKGYQMKKGVEISKGKVIVFLDGDGTDPPKFIPKLIKKLRKYDIVLGARNLSARGSDRKYKLIFAAYMPFMKGFFRALGFETKGDPLAGFRAMHRKTWDALGLEANDFIIETEMNIKAVELGLKIGEVPIPILRRSGGLLRSKLVRSLDQWVKILNYGIACTKGKETRQKLSELKEKFYAKTQELLKFKNFLFH